MVSDYLSRGASLSLLAAISKEKRHIPFFVSYLPSFTATFQPPQPKAFDETSSAMKRMLDGGGKPLEMIQVAISFLQSFSLVALIEMEWPAWFTGFKMFTLDFAFMDDAGDWPMILVGLFTAPFLILQLDHGLFVRRNDDYIVQKTVTDEGTWAKRRNFLFTIVLICIFWIMGFVISRGLSFSGYGGGFAFGISFVILVWNLQGGWVLPSVEGMKVR